MSNDIFTVATNYVVNGYENANNTIVSYRKAVEDTSKVEERASKASQKNEKSKQRLTRATRDATSAQQRARQNFLATANSIAVLDGPLGGVASRFSAFGVLIGRIGIPLATFSIAMTALGVITSRTVRNFMEFETQTNRIDAVLRATNNTFGTTSAEVNSMAASIALATLESENNVRAAATQLLTFRNVTKDVFEDVLKSASDLAALGFGTIESETVKLAKALEDPRQGLTSLSRAGVTFTRQQRALILSLVETGDRARAMELILANVNKQVGGAAEAAARDTLAGDFDTIGQAVNRAARGVGSFLGEMVRLVSSPAAKALEGFAAGPMGAKEQLAALEEVISAYNAQFEAVRPIVEQIEQLEANITDLSARERERLSGLRNIFAQEAANLGISDNINAVIAERNRLYMEAAEVERQAATAQLQRNADNVDGLLEEISMRERLIGLTDTQARNIRLLADAELLQADINEIIRERTDLLIAQGTPAAQAVRQAESLRAELEGITLESLNALSAREEMTRQSMRIASSVSEENELLAAQLGYINDGYTATVARRMALIDQERQILENTIKENELAMAVLNTNTYTADGIKNLEEQARLRAINLELEEAIAGLETREGLTRDIAAASRPSGPSSGGGGASGPSDAERIQELFEALERENQVREKIIGKSKEQAFIIERRAELEDRIRSINADLIDQYSERIDQMIEEELRIQKLMDAEQKRQDMRETFERNIESALMSMVDGSKSVEDAFKNMLRNIILEIYRQQVAKSMASNITSLFGFAKGGAFSGGNIVPFAQGGVVNSPTLFPMSGRKTGLMGEAGPEAIMPLTRGSDGKLGVKAEGVGGGDVVINFNVSANGDESVKQIILQQMPAMTESVKAAVADGKRRGGSYGRAFG